MLPLARRILRKLPLKRWTTPRLLLTTFPEHRSANVGDKLISTSFVDMARRVHALHKFEMRFRSVPFDKATLTRFGRYPIFLPGMSISNDFYPGLYSLHSDPDRIPRGIIPFGCTWQHPIGFTGHAEQYVLTDPSLSLLKRIVADTGPIAVRDHLAERILTRNGIEAITVGDCAWYHLPSHRKPMRRVREVRKLAITTPHSLNLVDQSIEVIDMARAMFPAAEIAIFNHSRPTDHVLRVLAHAQEKGVAVVEAAGDVGVFDRYDEFDLHLGHRLHGHIGFLRRRIPSVLLMEDARSRGFSSSIPVGCFAAKRSTIETTELLARPTDRALQSIVADENAVERVRDFVQQELKTGFARFVGVSKFLDTMLEEVALPQLREKVRRAKTVLSQREFIDEGRK